MELFSKFKQMFFRKIGLTKVDAPEFQALPISLVIPNYEQIITFQVNADEPVLHICIELLCIMAKILHSGIYVSGRIVIFHCPDIDTADAIRENWNA